MGIRASRDPRVGNARGSALGARRRCFAAASAVALAAGLLALASCDAEFEFEPSSDPLVCCSPTVPKLSGACGCTGEVECRYEACAATGERHLATCTAEGWRIRSESCRGAVASCYGSETSCEPGQLCMKSDVSAQWVYTCVADPCWFEDLSCACANRACPEGSSCEYVNPAGSAHDPLHMWCMGQ
jgi:hypothetical protein